MGSGIPITPLGLNINSDLSFQSNNLNLVRAVRMNNQSIVLSGAGDVAQTYVKGGDLYYNNASGIPVQVTNGTVVNSNAVAATIFPQTSAASNFTILSSATYIEVLVQTTAGSYTISLPSCAAVGAGRYFIIKDVTGNANTNYITIVPAGADTIDKTSSNVFKTSFQSAFFVSDGSGNWNILSATKTEWNTGEVLTVDSGATFVANSGSTLTINGATTFGAGTTTNLDGYANVNGGGVTAQATLDVTNGGLLKIDTTGTGSIFGTVSVKSGGNLDVNSGGVLAGQGAATIVSTTSGAFQHQGGAGDYVTFSSPRSLNKRYNLVPLSLGNAGVWALNQIAGSHFSAFVGIGQITTTGAVDNAFVVDVPHWQGANLSSVTLYFIVANNTLPAVLPQMSITRSSWTAGSSASTGIVYLNAGDNGIGGGLPISTATTGTAWFSGGNVQAFSYSCNQNNTLDHGSYNYFISIVGESGSGSTAGDLYIGMQCLYTNITSMQFP
jgi:hypothetical protein